MPVANRRLVERALSSCFRTYRLPFKICVELHISLLAVAAAAAIHQVGIVVDLSLPEPCCWVKGARWVPPVVSLMLPTLLEISASGIPVSTAVLLSGVVIEGVESRQRHWLTVCS